MTGDDRRSRRYSLAPAATCRRPPTPRRVGEEVAERLRRVRRGGQPAVRHAATRTSTSLAVTDPGRGSWLPRRRLVTGGAAARTGDGGVRGARRGDGPAALARRLPVGRRADRTPRSSPYAIEEAYEVAEAVETGDRAALREELGDLLLQVVFHARVAAGAPERAVRRRRRGRGHRRQAASGATRTCSPTPRSPTPRRGRHGAGTGSRRPRSERDVGCSTASRSPCRRSPAPRRCSRRARGPAQPSLAAAAPHRRRRRLGARLLALVAEARRPGVDAEGALRAAVARVRAAGARRRGRTATAGAETEPWHGARTATWTGAPRPVRVAPGRTCRWTRRLDRTQRAVATRAADEESTDEDRRPPRVAAGRTAGRRDAQDRRPARALGYDVVVEAGAGAAASFSDAAYAEAGRDGRRRARRSGRATSSRR